MTISIQRLTLFAIFDAIEKDLREKLISELIPYHNIENILNPNELDKVHDRFIKAEANDESVKPSETELVQYLDFLDNIHILNRNKGKLSSSSSSYLSKITPTLEKCAPIRNAVMHGRPLEIDYFATVCNIASGFSNHSEGNWKHLSHTLSEIENDSSYVFGLSFTIIEESVPGIYNNLPIPDFDDTGFVGRKPVIRKVVDAINGPFPVISLIGSGGVGKTALALKVANELLESEDSNFEAIVWVSAKANTLTAKEIGRIEDAIEDSIGIFSSVVEEFETNSRSDPEESVLQLMETFNVLLIIDNLETVLDDRLRKFIQRTPTGSKILLTSRIGIGSGDLAIEIEPLTLDESRIYLRKLVQVYYVGRLESIGQETADAYLKRLFFNPLIIKWFVTATKSGLMPERLLANQKDILKFCLENVVENLDEQSKSICTVYLVADGPHSLPMLARLTEFLSDELVLAISKLIRWNVLTMVAMNDLGDTAYQMAELPRAYFRSTQMMSTVEAKLIGQRYRNVQTTIEEVTRFKGKDVYRFSNFHIENKDQAVVASQLKKVTELILQKKLREADDLLSSIRALAPGYFEVERVAALLKFEQKDYVAAHKAYDLARELKPDYAPLWFWYGGFLLRAYNDLDKAYDAFCHAQRILPNVEVEREIARVLLYMNKFDEAKVLLDNLIDKVSMQDRHAAKLIDLKIQCFLRNADHQLKVGEFQKALELLLDARKHAETIPSEVYDLKMADKYRKMLPLLDRIYSHFEGTPQEPVLERLQSWASEFSIKAVPKGRIGRYNYLKSSIASSVVDTVGVGTRINNRYSVGDVCDGVVARISDDRQFGFIRTTNGHELFFHQSAVSSYGECYLMTVGVSVELTIGTNAKGLCASEVKLKFANDLEELYGDSNTIRGLVVNRRLGADYGSVIIADFGELRIRKSEFIEPNDWIHVREGDEVEFVVDRYEEAGIATRVKRV